MRAANSLLNDKITNGERPVADRQNPIQGCYHFVVGITAVIAADDVYGFGLIKGQVFGKAHGLGLEGFA